MSRSVGYAPAPIHPEIVVPSPRKGIFASAFDDLFKLQHKGLIPWLDLLRTVAILLVVGEHCLELGFSGPAAHAFYWGWTGVDLFFILSGFLIGRQLWKELKESGTVNVGRFLLRRGLRIWPLYFAAVLAYFVWSLATGLNLRPLLADVFFVSNYFHCRVKGGWSLSTEEQFYIAAPVLLFLLRFASKRFLVAVPVVWMIVLPLLRYEALASSPGTPVSDVIYSPIHLHSDGLAAGLILSWLAVFCPKWWSSGKAALWLPAVVIGAGLALRFAGKDVFSYSALALIYGGAALFGLRVHAANRIASWRGLFVISRLSYGMYLNHLVFIEAVPAAWVRSISSSVGTNPLAFAAAFLAVGAASLSVAFVTFALIERPGLQLRERLFKAPAPQKARAAAAVA